MHPILFEFGFIKIFTYGLLVATGFLAAILFASSRAEKEGLDSQKILDLCFYIMLSALIGARFLYVIVEYKYFLTNPIEIFKFWKGGFSFLRRFDCRCYYSIFIFKKTPDAFMENR
jgi:phosphatidylglycerol:prolipoprotein diacylglycerol transferase